LIVSLIAMGIVVVYRSSRVINFAVGDLGVPAAALLAVMAGKSHWPYWPSLLLAVLSGTLAGTVVELAVIRRLFRAARVIAPVAVAVRAPSTKSDLRRLAGVSPKLMSTAVWTIGGFLSAISIILYATEQGSSDLVSVGPETLLLGLTGALIGGMRSFPRAVVG